MKVLNVLHGADPELFLKSSTTGKPIVSIGLIGGSKSFPRDLGNGFALQEDNVTVEFNIPPCENVKKFQASIDYVLSYLKQELTPKGLELDIVPTVEFTAEDLLHPQAQELGCEPDFNAWNGRKNPRPFAPETLRSSGGHIHIGYDNPTVETSRELIKAHDLFCGVASVMYDPDVRRRQIYGKAGAHRIKGYGVEYRTLSNFWIKTPELTNWVYEQSQKAIAFVNEGNKIPLNIGRKIISCINTGDKNLVKELDLIYKVL